MYSLNPKCQICEHFCRNNNDGLLFGCRAFPDGIPDSVRDGYLHNAVVAGQVGNFVFKQRDENNLTEFAKWLKELEKSIKK